jgi:hypothetical protein
MWVQLVCLPGQHWAWVDGADAPLVTPCVLLCSNTPVDSCGSGLTACVVALAVHQVSGQLPAVYDGSWSEYGQPQLNTPIITGSS